MGLSKAAASTRNIEHLLENCPMHLVDTENSPSGGGWGSLGLCRGGGILHSCKIMVTQEVPGLGEAADV